MHEGCAAGADVSALIGTAAWKETADLLSERGALPEAEEVAAKVGCSAEEAKKAVDGYTAYHALGAWADACRAADAAADDAALRRVQDIAEAMRGSVVGADDHYRRLADDIGELRHDWAARHGATVKP